MLNVNANMFVQVSYMDEQNKKRKEKFHFNACFFSNENLFDRSICNDDDFASYFPTLRSFFCNSLGNVYTDLKFKNFQVEAVEGNSNFKKFTEPSIVVNVFHTIN